MSNKWLTAAVAILGIGLITNFIWTNRNDSGKPLINSEGGLNPTYWWANNQYQAQGVYAAPKMYVDSTGIPSPNWLQGGGSVVTNSTGRWAA